MKKFQRNLIAFALTVSVFAQIIAFDLPMAQASVPQQGTQSQTQQGFIDVSPDDWFYPDVTDVVSKGIMVGMPGEPPRFHPHDTITRAQFAVILHRMSGNPGFSNIENPFSDVRQGTWYTEAVIWGASRGMIQGRADGRFDPNANVTREEVAVLIYRWQIAENRIPRNAREADWPDEDQISSWALNAVNTLTMQRLFNYWPYESFGPQTPATRAEVASALHWLF